MATDLVSAMRAVGLIGNADPAGAASARLPGFTTTVQRSGEIPPFETVVQKAAAEQPSTPAASNAAPVSVPANGADRARRSFEAFALQVFIGSMLPKENAKLFGTGSAGKLWQSLLAEKLADQISASGRLRLLPDMGARAGPTTALPAALDAAGVKSDQKKEAL